MATTSFSPRAGAPAAASRLDGWLRAAALTALLAGLPALAPRLEAQQPAAIRASAWVSTSVLAAVVRPEAGPAAVASPTPATRRIRIEGVGSIDVQAGPGAAVRVGPVERPLAQPTITIQVFTVGS